MQALDAALTRFAHRALESIEEAEPGIRHRLDQLEERCDHWEHEVQHWQNVCNNAENEEESSEAAFKLDAAEDELRRIRYYQKRVNETYQRYLRQTEELRELCTEHRARAHEFLKNKIDLVHAYMATQPADESGSTDTTLSPRLNVSGVVSADHVASVISGFDESDVMDNESATHFVETQIPLTHLSELTRVTYAPDYKLTDDSQPILGEITENRLTGKYDTVVIYRHPAEIDNAKAEMMATIAHEIGHNVYFNILDGATRSDWTQLSALGRGYVTGYAQKNVAEDFAESYAIYITDPELLKLVDRQKYKFLRDRVFHGREYH